MLNNNTTKDNRPTLKKCYSKTITAQKQPEGGIDGEYDKDTEDDFSHLNQAQQALLKQISKIVKGPLLSASSVGGYQIGKYSTP